MPHSQFNIQQISPEYFIPEYKTEFYSLIMFRGKNEFAVDETVYFSDGNTLLFLTPYQQFKWKNGEATEFHLMHFHGDFYCIEYHKKEVACNGLLFNNIYQKQHLEVSSEIWDEIIFTLNKMAETQLSDGNNYAEAVVRSYLQLILAISSKEKAEELANSETENPELNNEMQAFRELLENNFIAERNISFYADCFNISPQAFSKKIKKELGKSPMQLIQERVILEAKKLLHLSYKSVKEIAGELNFEDEFYFSRYFKKNVGLSPTAYRDKVGISIVAKMSM